jgi:hypothetical protein
MILLPVPPAEDTIAPAAPDFMTVDDTPAVSLAPQASSAEAPQAGPDPSPSEIALEAYFRYLGRGAEDGHALEDWLEAEQALRERYEQGADN